MDILIEIVLEVYMELMFLIVPERNITKKQKLLVKLAAIVVTVGLLALAFWGIVLIADQGNLWGIAPITAAVALSLVQIVMGIVLYRRDHD